MKFDPAKMVSGKKRKRAKTLQSGFGAAGKRAQKKLLKVLPKALKFIDRKRGKARSSRLLSAPALASASCSPGEAGPIGHTGGASVGLLGTNGGYIDAPAGGGVRVRITFYSCGGVSNFRIPQCPTADGSVDSGGSGDFSATIEILENGRVASRQSSVFDEKAKAHGEVGADAKLKSIELEHTMEIFIVANGDRGQGRGGAQSENHHARWQLQRRRRRRPLLRGQHLQRLGGELVRQHRRGRDHGRYREAEPHWSTFPPQLRRPGLLPREQHAETAERR